MLQKRYVPHNDVQELIMQQAQTVLLTHLLKLHCHEKTAPTQDALEAGAVPDRCAAFERYGICLLEHARTVDLLLAAGSSKNPFPKSSRM